MEILKKIGVEQKDIKFIVNIYLRKKVKMLWNREETNSVEVVHQLLNKNRHMP